MSFFGKKRTESIVLVDIAGGSVGGACVIDQAGGAPAVAYAERVALEPHEGESQTAALARAFATLCDSLLKAGGPALLRAAGSGTPGRILVVIGAPFEEPVLRVERIQGEKGSFTFSKQAVAEAMRRQGKEQSGTVLADEAVIATFLDGYRTRTPWGRKAHRASIVLLSSAMKQEVAAPIAATLRGVYHTHHIEASSGALAFSRALAVLFPHEEEYIAIVVRDEAATLLLVRESILYAVATTTLSNDPAAALTVAFAELAKQSPLPHSVFLVAEEERREELKKVFADPRFAPLWLSDNPPRLLPVLPEHLQLSGGLKLVGDAHPDLFLGLLALFCTQPGEPER